MKKGMLPKLKPPIKCQEILERQVTRKDLAGPVNGKFRGCWKLDPRIGAFEIYTIVSTAGKHRYHPCFSKLRSLHWPAWDTFREQFKREYAAVARPNEIKLKLKKVKTELAYLEEKIPRFEVTTPPELELTKFEPIELPSLDLVDVRCQTKFIAKFEVHEPPIEIPVYVQPDTDMQG